MPGFYKKMTIKNHKPGLYPGGWQAILTPSDMVPQASSGLTGENSWRSEIMTLQIEPPHDKSNKMTVRPAKTRISLGIRPV